MLLGLPLLVAAPVHAVLDLTRAVDARLDNGLEVLVLEERALPVVSVQTLYKVGGRNEETGRTGLAHFLEHMAFRSTENFPGTEVASRIYAVGGEWHAYTWIDQTTYYATAPRQHLDLLLRIAADRMARLLLPADEVEAERGAVLAELHGYENDAASVLYDAVVAAAILQHPYRYNVIGWQSDVERIDHQDVVDFYRRYYRPANAVLAVVGDVEAPAVLARVRELFGGLPAGGATPLPHTVEPPQTGLRRLELVAGGGRSYFRIAYPAPPFGHRDFAAMMLLQEILGGSDGVNFRQEDFGVPVRAGSRLADVEAEVATWLPATAQPYLFMISGSVEPEAAAPEAGRDGLEAAVEARVRSLREAPVGATELAAARQRLDAALVFDLETTEDAAHELAYYAGLGALEARRQLPARLDAVTAADIQRVAGRYLAPWRRTVGWSIAGAAAPPSPEGDVADGSGTAASMPPDTASGARAEDASRSSVASESGTSTEGESLEPFSATGRVGAGESTGETAAETAGEDAWESAGETGEATGKTAPVVAAPPTVHRLAGGVPVLVRRVPLSPTALLSVLVPSTQVTGPVAAADDPVWRHTALDFPFLAGRLEEAIAEARVALGALEPVPAAEPPDDPEARLAYELREMIGAVPGRGPARPAAIALVGDVDPAWALPLLEAAFGELAPASVDPALPVSPQASRRVVLPGGVQAQLGYAVPAPPPSDADYPVWRMLLYVLTHDYEGRFGKEAIGRRGLLYYVSSAYHFDGPGAWIEISMGVDPAKLAPAQQLFEQKLAELVSRPPDEAELAEAKQYLLGRRQSAYQSNGEIAGFLLREWVAYGALPGEKDFARRLDGVQAEDLARVAHRFVAGAVAVVEVGGTAVGEAGSTLQ